MTLLAQERCASLDKNPAPLAESEKERLKEQVPDWRVEIAAGVPELKRVFPFKEYRKALDFVRKVGELAEEEDHHPAMTVERGSVTVRWSTHSIRGLHRNDFVMAAKTDGLHEPGPLPGIHK